MKFEEIHEPIEVIAHFDGKSIKPLRFRWTGRAYRISRVNSAWSAAKGRAREYHFHVSTKESNSFELIYTDDILEWKIGRVCLEG